MGLYNDKTFCLDVAGDFACFTRPEMKVERVSYDVPTPSAVRAIFEAIFWKPAFKWRVRKIEVINEIKWISVRRNEIGCAASPSNKRGIFIEENRQQRAGLFLRDVRYRFHADLVFVPVRDRPKGQLREAGPDENPQKYNEMFERRARAGQCFNMPYLGCREFSCGSFRLVDDPASEPGPLPETRSLGYMLYDLDYSDAKNPVPMFFRAEMRDGVIDVPDWDSAEVLR